MKKQIFFILIALTFSSTAVSAQIRRTDFRNRSYQSPLCTEVFEVPNPVTVKRGKFAEGEVIFEIVGRPVFADLDGDGSEEAVVHAQCASTAGNFTDSDIFVYGMERRRLKRIASIDSNDVERDFKRYFRGGFVVAIKSAQVKGGRVVIEAYTDGSNASPKYISSLTYRLSGGKLAITGRPARRVNR